VLFDPLARVLLAMYLAIWTPAMCCCAIKMAMGGRPCADQIDSGAACCGAPPRPLSCCDSRSAGPGKAQRDVVGFASLYPPYGDADEVGACCDEGAAAGSAPLDDDRGCTCHERKIDRLDTGGKVTLPGLAADALAAMALPITLIAMMPAAEYGASRDVCRRAHPPPTTSLLAQRCLLII
jgi:hypothetical protein